MVKKAKKVAAKKVKNAPKKKTKRVAVKKVKASAKKKIKSVEKKKIKKNPKNKTKKIIVKTVKRAKKTVKKLVKVPVKTKSKIVAKKSAKPARPAGGKVATKKVESPSLNIALPKIEMHGEDLHLIPDHQPQKPISTIEVHAAENTFHHKEEVAFHQENKKVQQSIISQKNAKRFGRRTGRR